MVSLERSILLLAAGLLLAGACGEGETEAPPLPRGDGPVAPSLHPRVKFKGDIRLEDDVARALGLAPDQVCNELGRYSCTREVHRVALGGTSAYDLGLFTPLPFTSLTTPMAAERVAMAACATRVDRDLAGEGLIFADVDLDGRGRLVDPDGGAVSTAIDTLYRRALQRRVGTGELAHLRRLYRDIEARAVVRPARDWAVLSCFAVMTTMEQLFY
jgi:hypothetical protein